MQRLEISIRYDTNIFTKYCIQDPILSWFESNLSRIKRHVTCDNIIYICINHFQGPIWLNITDFHDIHFNNYIWIVSEASLYCSKMTQICFYWDNLTIFWVIWMLSGNHQVTNSWRLAEGYPLTLSANVLRTFGKLSILTFWERYLLTLSALSANVLLTFS